jgi:hypothetical protein
MISHNKITHMSHIPDPAAFVSLSRLLLSLMSIDLRGRSRCLIHDEITATDDVF